MEDVPFDRPVDIANGRVVKTVGDAADVLLNHWPDNGGSKHLAARKACLAVLEGLKKAHIARKAFEAAAAEAKMLDTEHDDLMARMMASMRPK